MVCADLSITLLELRRDCHVIGEVATPQPSIHPSGPSYTAVVG